MASNTRVTRHRHDGARGHHPERGDGPIRLVIVYVANEVGKLLTGDELHNMKKVRDLINAHELVWGVWQGGMMSAKGEGMQNALACAA